ncbi:MAG: hypothetical protein HY748_10030 [Elusimicrobia bacterium]|nr:hypothetical protein [Elusimicrobiota bacterium]
MGPLGFLLAAALAPARLAWAAPEGYGAKGIFPVYDVSGEWVVYDKKSAGRASGDPRLRVGNRFLVVGSLGASVFAVTGSTAGYGGACKGHQPLRLRAAVLDGPRKEVGIPVIAIQAPPKFNLRRPQAKFRMLRNQVGEQTYQRLLGALKARLKDEVSSGEFRLKADDEPADSAEDGSRKPEADALASAAAKIDFGAVVSVAGLSDPFVLVEGTQVKASYRRCLRLANGGVLVGSCAVMRHELMAETSRLEFVSYDPSGQGKPFVLAYTPSEPLWGHERWGFALRKSGPRLFLGDSMDIRCREGF